MNPLDLFLQEYRVVYPHAHVGFLLMRRVSNPPVHPELEAEKSALQERLRLRWGGLERKELEKLPILQAYNQYYKAFKKSYHVQLQLESILFKGKQIPSVSALVESMFMAEVDHLLLTAGHDLDRLELPVTVAVAGGDEKYTLLRGVEQTLKSGDMLIQDRQGIISSIIYGPDQRTQITPHTANVLFTVYGVPGISVEQVRAHLETIQSYVHIFAPQAQTENLQIL